MLWLQATHTTGGSIVTRTCIETAPFTFHVVSKEGFLPPLFSSLISNENESYPQLPFPPPLPAARDTPGSGSDCH